MKLRARSVLLLLISFFAQAQNDQSFVHKHILHNGLTVLVRPTQNTQPVSIRLVVNVGSKHEQSDEKGIAHLIEHMLFKGTEKLSEVDINVIADKVGGYVNAHTTRDTTTVVFDFPLSAWKVAFPILAECLHKCTFKQDLLHSELKAVIQELKMYRDSFWRTLSSDLVTAIYPDHPYHYPLIGYKQHLWNCDVALLKKFYDTYYIPRNATLVVVGNVNPQDVFDLAEQCFGTIQDKSLPPTREFYIQQDLKVQNITLYRPVQKPRVMLAFRIPGLSSRDTFVMSTITSILKSGKTSRLYKKLEEPQLVDALDIRTLDLFDDDILFFIIEPREILLTDRIITIIKDELNNLATTVCALDELRKIIKRAQKKSYTLWEENATQADLISEFYLAKKDENYIYNTIFNYNRDLNELAYSIKHFASTYLRPALMHRGQVLPLPDGEELAWREFQKRSDEEDARILGGKMRSSPLEQPRYSVVVPEESYDNISYPKPTIYLLSNGIKVLSYKTNHVPLITFTLSLGDTVPDEKKDALHCLSLMLARGGTSHKSESQLAHEFEHSAISYSITAGRISGQFLAQDLSKALALLNETLTSHTFDDKTLQEIKQDLLISDHDYWDDESRITSHLATASVYYNIAEHNQTQDVNTVLSKMNLDDIKEVYDHLSPLKATISIVGDLPEQDELLCLLESTFGSWNKTSQANEPLCTKLEAEPTQTMYYMDRDQVTLTFAGPSVTLLDPDYYALLLYNSQLQSRLFNLRQHTGFFYSISGSVINDVDWEPGYMHIETLVSPDRVEEAKALIHNFIEKDIETFDEESLNIAKNQILKSRDDIYQNNESIKSTFLYFHKYELPFDYLELIKEKISTITLAEVKTAVKKILDKKKISIVMVGRVGEVDMCSETSIT